MKEITISSVCNISVKLNVTGNSYLMLRFWGFIIFAFSSVSLFSQSTGLDVSSREHKVIDRLVNKYLPESNIHQSVKPYRRSEVTKAIKEILKSDEVLSSKDKNDLQRLIDDNNDFWENDILLSHKEINDRKKFIDSTEVFYYLEQQKTISDKEGMTPKNNSPILKYFYSNPSFLYSFDNEYLKLRVNPIINLRFGKDLEDNDRLIFQNTRGLEVRGMIDNKVYFYSNLLENQGNFLSFIDEGIGKYQSIPGFGSFKNFNSTVSDKFAGYDFPNSSAYVGLNVSKHIGIEFGHGKHFIGNGYRSLLLSNYANNYFYLKFSTQLWKFHYQNLFAELAPITSRQNPGDKILPKKYMANHYLSIKPAHNFEIGLFETIMFSRENHFEFQYLNPIIFYRTVEFFLDSPDNVLLGLNTMWKPTSSLQLYGQIVLDEFKLNEILDRSGWWANKYGFQLGIKYFDVIGIDHLNLQVEYNQVRPYTYAHRDSIADINVSVANYSHFTQALAHPLGANFRELNLLLDYQLNNRFNISSKVIYAKTGEDDALNNWGGDIVKPVFTFVNERGNFIGQGLSKKILSFDINFSYEFYRNYWFDFNYMVRSTSHEIKNDTNVHFFGGGIRANIENLDIPY